ncbi:hypothetical protein PV10_03371 [Exophiala mesophila]|uniref:Uncharacterized protein n=1 Tax=Exophiala mesophila TaxID=212818 RepID=A0A0D1X1V2_EXOME|nr:uncharacterized protein PV10_03371 [Exophiala mesophila]KIV95755.1 hypothetical protein PV10_03371 [Exophiala mesophila]
MRDFVPGPKEFSMKNQKCWKHRPKGRRQYTEQDVENSIERMEEAAEYRITHAEAISKRDEFGWGPDNTPDGKPPVYRRVPVDPMLDGMSQSTERGMEGTGRRAEELARTVDELVRTVEGRENRHDHLDGMLSEMGTVGESSQHGRLPPGFWHNDQETQSVERLGRIDDWDISPAEARQGRVRERELEEHHSTRPWERPETPRGRRRDEKRRRHSPDSGDERRGRRG